MTLWQIGMIALVVFIIFVWRVIRDDQESNRRFRLQMEKREAYKKRNRAEDWVRTVVRELGVIEPVEEGVVRLTDPSHRNNTAVQSLVRHGILKPRGDGAYDTDYDNYDSAPPSRPDSIQPITGHGGYAAYLKSSVWMQRREEAKRRAGNRCQVCNSKSNLEVHHRSYANLGGEKPEDLTVLCASCHRHFHQGGRMPVR